MRSSLDYPGDRGQYGPSVSFREYHGYDEGCAPIWCAEHCGEEVLREGQTCKFCTILLTEGEAAAEKWFDDNARRKLMHHLEDRNVIN